MSETYCSHNEDREMLELFGNLEAPFYVDVGANDGITGSNSYLLEQNGWQGILVEPNPVLVEQIKGFRTANVVPCLISNELGEVDFHVVTGPGNLHGLSRIDATDDFFEHVKKHGGEVHCQKVTSKDLTMILRENNVPQNFEFLSIDVEGHELNVLETLDFETFSPQIIMLEDNSKGFDKKPLRFLESKGYSRVHRTGVNDWYTKDLKHLFAAKRLKAAITFMRWDLKRSLYRLIGKEYKNNLI